MFFYLHSGQGFNCLHVRWMKRCLISYFLCGNPQNNFGPHKTWKNLGLETVKWKTVMKVGVAALRPMCLHMRNISPRRCQIHCDFLYFISRQHMSLFHTRNIAMLHFQQNFSTANVSNSKISTERSQTSTSYLVV